MASSINGRLDELERRIKKENKGLVVVNGLGKTPQQIDEEVTELRTKGHLGLVIVLDV